MTPSRSAALSRVLRARRERDDAEHALRRLCEPAAFLALSATLSDVAAVRPVLERHAERRAEAHEAALLALGRELSRPATEPTIGGTAP